MHSLCRTNIKNNYLRGEFKDGHHAPPCLINAQANAGDSRSVLGVKGRAKPLSFDHKPQNEGGPQSSTFGL